MPVLRRAAGALSLLGLLLGLADLLGPAAAPIGRAQLGPAANVWATAVDFSGSDKLLVQDDDGLTYRVQYIGVRGPVRSSGINANAAAFHGALVLGRRVRLESDGKDEEGGYKLRHVYLEGEPLPVGAAIVAAGWGTAAPYPLDHRHRALYLLLQQQAIAQQVALWQPGMLGPAVPWRPPASAEPGYVAADPDLHPSLDLLYTVPTGRLILDRLVRTAPPTLFRDLPEGVGGYANPLGYFVVVSRKVGQADPRSLATAIAHEATHAIDFASGELDLTSFSCFELEQRSHGMQAQVWSEYFGPGGKPDPQDDWDRAHNDVLRFAQRGDLQNYVRRSAGYEVQCAGERVLP